MTDEELINQITDLQRIAEVSENPLPIEQVVSSYDQIISLYGNLSKQTKKTMKNQLYIAHRNLGRLYFHLKKFEKVLYHLEEAKKLPEYQNEEFVIKLWMDSHIVSSKIKLYLKTNSKTYLKNVKGINNSLLNQMDKIGDENLKYEINFNNSLLEGKIKTVIWFEIPPALPIQENTPINFKFNGVDHILKIEIVKNPEAFLDSGSFVEIIEDKYGLINRSKIKLTIFKYIDPEERVEIKTFSEKTQQLKILLEALNALNYFIERYKILTGNYWIEPVFYKMIKNFTFENQFENQERHLQYGMMDHPTIISPTVPWLKNEELNDLKKCLNKEKIPLWEILFLDAKDYLLKRSFRESIYAINGAFENYLTLKAREKLINGWENEENVAEYLKGKPIYKYHKLRKYMDKKTFKKAVKDGDISTYVPSAYQIIKECRDANSTSIEKEQSNKLVGKIRKRRNDVLHGVEIHEDLENIAFEAIKSFEEFVKIFK